ncbi:FecR family protein [Marinagarivorans cellulosilyticus]|uniref:Transmembrane sensor n=1 Tax=Marinagarivorans cellulosilyticus TaxID=2721545 RepID=A0AAN1WLE2_9GAMM|nr:FecR domain-containing protein [Marinagarivorans cellulosilyticus]BCD99698.1 transmembrane sensor [Marinagarivorans cellulosilyticus]
MDELSQHRENINEQASDWFALIYLASPSKAEILAFEKWCSVKESHRKAYQELITLWHSLPEQEARTAPLIPLETPNLAPQKRKHFLSRRMALFLGAAAACGGIFAVATIQAPNKNVVHYQTAISETSRITLPDGSHIELSGKTHIQYAFDGKRRVVTLYSGQAYFDVNTIIDQYNRKVPFEVISGPLNISVVGTAFDVKKQGDKATVTVAEGIVKAHTFSAKSTRIIAGQSVSISSKSPAKKFVINEVELKNIASWREGRLVYVDATLDEVMSDARRFHNGAIILGDSSLAKLRVTATFRADQINEMVTMLEQLLPINVYLEPNGRIVILEKHESKT